MICSLHRRCASRASVALHGRLLEIVGKQFSVPMFPKRARPASFWPTRRGWSRREAKLLRDDERERPAPELVVYYRRVIPDALKSVELKERIHANGFFRHLQDNRGLASRSGHNCRKPAIHLRK